MSFWSGIVENIFVAWVGEVVTRKAHNLENMVRFHDPQLDDRFGRSSGNFFSMTAVDSHG